MNNFFPKSLTGPGIIVLVSVRSNLSVNNNSNCVYKAVLSFNNDKVLFTNSKYCYTNPLFVSITIRSTWHDFQKNHHLCEHMNGIWYLASSKRKSFIQIIEIYSKFTTVAHAQRSSSAICYPTKGYD